MDKTIKLTVNGQARTITTDPRRRLLDVLREDLQLTGTKFGCGEAMCGACTVLVNGKPTFSCVTPIEQVADQQILTIEGLARGDALHPVQEAFLAEAGFQCGYCTPGMILLTVALLGQKPNPTEEDIRAFMNGHVCRCCGYRQIMQAVRRVAASGSASAGGGAAVAGGMAGTVWQHTPTR